MSDIRRSLLLEAPIELVWSYLTESDKLAEWLMPNTFQPIAGHDFTMRCAPMDGSSGIVQAKVMEIEAPRRLVYSWIIDVPPLETLVAIDLKPEESGTRLTLVHSGWEGLADDAIHVRERHAMGWDHLLATALAAALAASAPAAAQAEREGAERQRH